MESKGCKRFATTTEAEIEEKRLKLNAERVEIWGIHNFARKHRCLSPLHKPITV
jgi:hypothetical protein